MSKSNASPQWGPLTERPPYGLLPERWDRGDYVRHTEESREFWRRVRERTGHGPRAPIATGPSMEECVALLLRGCSGNAEHALHKPNAHQARSPSKPPCEKQTSKPAVVSSRLSLALESAGVEL